MCESQESYYLVKFKTLWEEYYTIWYTDEMDAFLLDMDKKIRSFLTKEEAIDFVETQGFFCRMMQQ